MAELTHERMDEGLFWVVLGPGTSDMPGAYLARAWVQYPDPQPLLDVVRAGDLETLRDMMPGWMVAVPRHARDDTNIIETWV